MSPATAYAALLAQLRRIEALDQVAYLLKWDAETQMPPAGAAQRAAQAGAVAAARHALEADPRMQDWCDAAERGELSATDRVNLAEARRMHRRAARVPERLAEALAAEVPAARDDWLAAREANDVAPLLRRLAALTALQRERAACLTEDGQCPYDALLDDYESGATGAALAALFGRLRRGLVALAGRIAGAPDPPGLHGRFPAEAQLALGREIAGRFGFDWRAGRLDLGVHPSSAGARGDVRITTRIDPRDPLGSIFAVIHETGHGAYDQRLDPALALQPAGSHASMGVHEAMARLFENQLGRSRAFCAWLHPALAVRFGDTGAATAEALYRAVNRVHPGFIRTEADEVHYNLHVMMRFDLERALIRAELEVTELEAAWNDRFRADFGRAVPDPLRGMLQDIHWPQGLVGYFPSYTIGNVYAGALHAALRRDLPGLDARLVEGDITPVLEWLGPRIYRLGRRLPPRALIEQASGAPVSEAPLLHYLETKYAELYRL